MIHQHTYDLNRNLIYINTSRVKRDGKEDEKVTEQKYRWDEENRLLAADENGFVSNYWYDADGERTVKTSGENEAIYVNSEFSGGNTSTARFSLYVSPYLVAGQGGKYTKHIYVGSQRIVSKLGDLASYGADPRRIPYAGSEADGLTVDYKKKYGEQLQAIKDNYKAFDIPYNGEDNDDYVNGQLCPKDIVGCTREFAYKFAFLSLARQFCCNDGTPEAAQARAMAMRTAKAKSIDGNFKPNDEYEKMQFYYHPDHLGSSSYITNLDGEVAQHIEYVPFGEVFIEERNNTWNTPYLFNAKEFDEETGMYYYGARYYEPRLSLWMSVDPLAEMGLNLTPYNFMFNNPLILIDPHGLWPIYSKDGTYLGNDGRYEKGKDLAFTGIAAYDKNGNITGYKGLSQFTDNHTQFQISSSIVKQEGTTADAKEYLWIAHTASNAAKESKTSLYKKLMSGYSSVPKSKKTPLSTSDNSTTAKAARAGVINVMSGETDPTGGATLWDGTDFLAWGLNSPNGTPQNKFEEYHTITIPQNIYNDFLNSQLSQYPKRTVKYYGKKYTIPASVFTDKTNWQNGSFSYSWPKASGSSRNLKATGTAGHSIFWRTEKR